MEPSSSAPQFGGDPSFLAQQQQQQQAMMAYDNGMTEATRQEAAAPEASSGEVVTFGVGDLVICESRGGWCGGKILETTARSKKRKQTIFYRVSFEGSKTDEWIDDTSKMLPFTEANLDFARQHPPLVQSEEVPVPKKERKKSTDQGPTKRRSSGGRTSHPTYADMVDRALEAVGMGKSGGSLVAVAKWIKDRYAVHETKYKQSVSAALKQGVNSGKFVKVKASFKFAPNEMKNRDRAKKGLPPSAPPPKPRRPDDLDVGVDNKRKPLPMPQFLLCLSPPAIGGDLLALCEFFQRFDDLLLYDDQKKKKSSQKKLSLADLDCCLSTFPLEGKHPETRLPPLVERVIFSLLRALLGRRPQDGDMLDETLRVEDVLYVGHNQNRRLWGHALNAATWPDLLRRHLAAERRFRQRARTRWPNRLTTSSSSSSKKESSSFYDDDEPRLKVALMDFCDNNKAFGHLSAESCAAILKSLVDDCLQTGPVVCASLREAEEQIDVSLKRFKAAQATKRKIEKLLIADDTYVDVEPFSMKTKAEALSALEIADKETRESAESLRAVSEHQQIRRESIGADRYCGRYWLNIASANRFEHQARLVVRVADNDERSDVVFDPWCSFDLGSNDNGLRKALDARGARENHLLDNLNKASDDNAKKDLTANDAQDAILAETRNLLPRLLRRPPPRDSVAYGLPWPADLDDAFERALFGPLTNDDPVEDNDESHLFQDQDFFEDNPRRSTRLVKDKEDEEEKGGRGLSKKKKKKKTRRSKNNNTNDDDDDDESDDDVDDDVDERAEEAALRAAPWRRRHPTIAHALVAFRTEVDDLAERIDAIIQGGGGGAAAKEKKENGSDARNKLRGDFLPADLYAQQLPEVPEKKCDFLAALCGDVLELEASLFGMLSPNAEDLALQEASSAADEERETTLLSTKTVPLEEEETAAAKNNIMNNNNNLERDDNGDRAQRDADTRMMDTEDDNGGGPPAKAETLKKLTEDDDFDWLERDAVLEDDYFALLGPCSEVPKWRALWRQSLSDDCLKSPGAFEARASRFATLYGSFAEAFQRHVPLLEARRRAAAKVLDGDGRRVTKPVFVPSTPQRVLWARMRGYPWWPAREHTPKAPHFAAALTRRKERLIIFIGEGIQYLINEESTAPYVAFSFFLMSLC